MIIAHLSDLHLDSSLSEIYGVNPYENLLNAISVLASRNDIDLAVITGDISNDGGRYSYQLADKALEALAYPVLILNGNHDDAKELLGAKYNKLRYEPQFSMFGIDFLSINTVAIAEDGTNRSRGIISNQDLNRIKELIAKGENRKIILMHHPATLTGSWLDKRILQNRNSFIECVSSSDKVVAVLSGHNHYATCERIGECLYCTAPSISTSFDKDLKPFEEAHTPGFNILYVDDYHCNVETVRI